MTKDEEIEAADKLVFALNKEFGSVHTTCRILSKAYNQALKSRDVKKQND